jgi:superfamily I DNA/RNA helicase
MISFYQYLTEISADPELIDILKSKNYTGRSSSKILPTTDGFNIIPLKISNDVYNLFKSYITSKYKLAENLLNRKGPGSKVKASNEELENIKELAKYIIRNSSEESEITIAKKFLINLSPKAEI